MKPAETLTEALTDWKTNVLAQARHCGLWPQEITGWKDDPERYEAAEAQIEAELAAQDQQEAAGKEHHS